LLALIFGEQPLEEEKHVFPYVDVFLLSEKEKQLVE
jgi:hypothetical protein